MKIRNIYLNKNVPVVSIVIALMCIGITVISVLVPAVGDNFSFTYPVRNPWQFITYMFEHYTPQEQIPPELGVESSRLSIGHLIYNLMLVLPFGVLVEKVIGTKKFLILSIAAWLADIATTFIMCAAITPEGEESICKGASGLAFSFVPVGLLILFVMGKKFGFGKLFKQISFYFLMPLAIMTLVIALSPSVAGITTIWSMLLHLIAVVGGIIFAVVFRKTIRGYFDNEENAKT